VAPELLEDKGYYCKADVFSAGVILYVMYAYFESLVLFLG